MKPETNLAGIEFILLIVGSLCLLCVPILFFGTIHFTKRNMKKLWSNYLAPTPDHIAKVQRVLLAVGSLGTIIAEGGAQFNFIPQWVAHTIALSALGGLFLAQFTKKADTSESDKTTQP